jgi:hypothetical protein
MPKPGALPPAVPRPAFSSDQARELGVSKSRLRSSDLSAPFHGVRSTSDASTVEERCRQYLPRLRSSQFFSHSTAAGLLEIPLPRRIEADSRLHVSDRMSRPRTAGVLGHRALETPTISFRGLPVTKPEWLLLELASILTVDELIVAGDGLVRRKRALSTLGQLQATAVTLDGRNIRKVRTAIRDVRSGTDSPMETRLRLLLIRARLPEPVIGYTIRNANGDFVGTPDLCYVEQDCDRVRGRGSSRRSARIRRGHPAPRTDAGGGLVCHPGHLGPRLSHPTVAGHPYRAHPGPAHPALSVERSKGAA